jgi:hypothetical protein
LLEPEIACAAGWRLPKAGDAALIITRLQKERKTLTTFIH